MANSLRVGFVGLGNQAAENLLPAIAQLRGAHLAAVCDLDPQKTARYERALSSEACFDRIEAMLNSGLIDLMIMACPPQVHTYGAKLSMAVGIPVFVEKPPCINLPTLLELSSLAAEHNVTTGVGLNFRFAEPVRKTTAILNSNRFGGLAHLDIRHFANKPRSPMWGMDSVVRSFLLAQSIHSFDLAVTLGGELTAVEAETDEIRQGVIIIRTTLRFANGSSAAILTGSAFPSFEFAMTALGRNSGVMLLENLSTLEIVDEVGGSFRPGEKRWSERWHSGPLESGYNRAGYLGELQAFVDAVAAGSEFEASFSAMIPTYEIIEKVCELPMRTAFSSIREIEHA